MYHDKPDLSDRQVRGLQLLQTKIKRKNKLHYKVLSQSEEGLWYDVIKRYGHNCMSIPLLDAHLDCVRIALLCRTIFHPLIVTLL